MKTRSMTQELALLQARELWRDARYFWFALLFPFGMLTIFLVIGILVPKGEGVPDFTKLVIPIALFLAVTSSSLTVTAPPLAALRSNGTLRLLGTTPVGPARFLLTHMLVRAVMVIVQAVVVLAIALTVGAVEPSRLPALFGITVAGIVLFGSIGYLVGGRIGSAEVAGNVATLIQLSTLFLSGLAMPLTLLPTLLATVLSYLPTTMYADLMTGQISGDSSEHPAWVALSTVLLAAMAFAACAVRYFKWDDLEGK
jgi:ABC-2 type transport system permease protein